MSAYPPPFENVPIFDASYFEPALDTAGTGFTINQLKTKFLTFPTAQSATETIPNLVVSSSGFAPTRAAGDNSTAIATTAFVQEHTGGNFASLTANNTFTNATNKFGSSATIYSTITPTSISITNGTLTSTVNAGSITTPTQSRATSNTTVATTEFVNFGRMTPDLFYVYKTFNDNTTYLAMTFDPHMATDSIQIIAIQNSGGAGGDMDCTAVTLFAGQTYSKVNVCVTTLTTGGPGTMSLGLYNSAGDRLATGTWTYTVLGMKEIVLSAPYICTVSGRHYVGAIARSNTNNVVTSCSLAAAPVVPRAMSNPFRNPAGAAGYTGGASLEGGWFTIGPIPGYVPPASLAGSSFTIYAGLNTAFWAGLF